MWPRAVWVPVGVGFTETLLPFCRRAFPSRLVPSAPCCCPGMSGTVGASGDKPAGKCISFWAESSWIYTPWKLLVCNGT